MGTFKEKGLDISHHQNDKGPINFKAMKNDGVSFVIVKATEGKAYKDPFYEKNVDDAQASGMKVGAYHFARFGSVADVQAELNHFINAIKGDGLNYPAVLDLETNDHGLSKTVLTDLAILFMEGLEQAGFFAMLYTGKSFLENNLDESRLKPYAKWIARYNSTLGRDADMWQYTSTGKVNGVVGNVDVNWNYRSDLFGEKGSVAVVQTPVQPAPQPVKKPTPQPAYIGKRVESKVAVLNYYDSPRWDRPFGQITKGTGFPTIVDKVKVDDSWQYKVRNSKGKIFYITASDKYVVVK
jgi:lysozyme